MTTDRQNPTVASILKNHDERIRRLEAKLTALIDERRTPLWFSFSGPLDEDVESQPLQPIHPTNIELIVPRVLVAPSGGDLTIDLKLNGSTIRTLTVPDGSTYSEDAVPFSIPMGFILTATVTAANGAESLAIALNPRWT